MAIDCISEGISHAGNLVGQELAYGTCTCPAGQLILELSLNSSTEFS
jgi:hypothetical protein